MRACHRHAGFTLLEMLVALVVGSLIITAAFGGLRVGQLSWAAGESRADVTEMHRAFSGFLGRQVGQALPLSLDDGDGERIAFEGLEDRLRFVAPAPFESGSTGLLIFTVSVDTSTGTSRLLLGHRPFDPGAPVLAESETQDVAQVIGAFGSVRLSYFGQIDGDRRPGWHAAWPADAQQVPQVVRLQFEASGGQGKWPDLVLPIFSERSP